MPKRKYCTRSQAKRARAECSINALPPEILQHIFLNLSFDDLLAVRGTCHFWRDAVSGCPALRDKFRLVFPHAGTSDKFKIMHRGYKPLPAVPASTVAFKYKQYFKIGYIGSWWPQVAATVTCLSLSHCQYPVAMLRHTPNLQSLELIYAAQIREARGSDADELDFELSKLRKLTLMQSSLGHLSRMITQLKILECYTYDLSATSMVEFVQSKIQSTLEDLIVEAPKPYLMEFTKLTGLGLKRVSFSYCNNEAQLGNFMVQFARLHPSIEDLSIANIFDDKVLYEVLRALPKLKRFNLGLKEIGISRYRELPKIPNVLPNLEYLHIEWKTSYYVDISGPKLCIPSDLRLSKLRDLYLQNVTLSGDSLSNFLSNTPALHTMTLHECDFDSWPQLLHLITQPKALRHLKLTSFQVLGNEDEPLSRSHQPHTSLRCLELGNFLGSGTSSEDVRAMFHLFPHLTELQFGPKAPVDDGLVLEMCRTLTQLERLTVYTGCTTHASTVNVRGFCRNLKHFALYSPFWALEKADVIYFSKHLQSFIYRGIKFRRDMSDALVSCIIHLLDLLEPVSESESDNESESDLDL